MMGNINLVSVGGTALGNENPVPMRLVDTVVPTTLPPHGTKSVTTAGTREALVASSTPLPRGGCYIIPYPTNTGVIYIGGASVTSTLCVRAGAGMMVPVAIDNAEDIWLDASVSGEGVSFIGF